MATTAEHAEAARLLEQLEQVRSQSRLVREYSQLPEKGGLGPYPFQQRFHAAGKAHVERCLMAGNRVGKTRTASGEVAIHLTGNYPRWWKGRRFDGPVRVWVGSETNEASRDIVQLALLGDPPGTGWIPKDLIHEKDPQYRQAGISNVVDTCRVRHRSGGWSMVAFKTYEQGRAKWQGTAQHLVWFDEEPPADIYTEGLTRTIDSKGMVMLTFTPLKGAGDVVHHFMDGGRGVFLINATWDDAPHLDPDEKDRLWESYPEHERNTRVKGIPMMGEGAVYPIADESIVVDAFSIPSHFRRICGIDFGISHAFAATWLAHDVDSDLVYVTDCWKITGQVPTQHEGAVRQRGGWIPVAWPHDGHIRDKGSGTPLAEQYRSVGMNLTPVSARYSNKTGGGQPREPVVNDILERMRTGRFKVFRHLEQWLEEKRLYHRKNGLIVLERDDIMSATQYGMMMLRFAETERKPYLPPAVQERYDPLAAFSKSR